MPCFAFFQRWPLAAISFLIAGCRYSPGPPTTATVFGIALPTAFHFDDIDYYRCFRYYRAMAQLSGGAIFVIFSLMALPFYYFSRR